MACYCRFRGIFIYLYRQHRTEIVVQMRSQIFRQIVHKFRRHTDVCQGIYVQDAGKYASRCAAKPSGGLCAVLPIHFTGAAEIACVEPFIIAQVT